MTAIKKLFLINILYLIVINATAQKKYPSYEIELGTHINLSDTTPFWLISNQNGKYSLINSPLFARVNIEKPLSNSSFIDFSYGMEFFNKIDTSYKPLLQQAYLRLKIWEIYIQAGRFEEFYSNHDTLLGSGSMIYSRNARPMPKIVVSSNGYVTVPFTFNKIEMKGMIAHGWFENDRYVKNLLLHNKNLYIKIGGDWKVNFHYGLEHAAQWGGNSPDSTVGQLPVDWDSYYRVLKGDGGDSTKVPIGEVTNKLGNHIGSRNVGIDFKLQKYIVGIYRQSIFEDNSGKKRMNLPDGLWGAYFKFKENNFYVSKIVYEFIYTLNQSGPIHDWSKLLVGNDNYFNHYIYKSGWTYYGYTLGTPFITSPIYNQDENISLKNTRVMAHHIGLSGQIEGIYYKTFITYSRNYGTHSKPFNPILNSFSFLLDVSVPIKIRYNFELNTKLGADFGKMYGNNFGFIISLKKKGFVYKPKNGN